MLVSWIGAQVCLPLLDILFLLNNVQLFKDQCEQLQSTISMETEVISRKHCLVSDDLVDDEDVGKWQCDEWVIFFWRAN